MFLQQKKERWFCFFGMAFCGDSWISATYYISNIVKRDFLLNQKPLNYLHYNDYKSSDQTLCFSTKNITKKSISMVKKVPLMRNSDSQLRCRMSLSLHAPSS